MKAVRWLLLATRASGTPGMAQHPGNSESLRRNAVRRCCCGCDKRMLSLEHIPSRQIALADGIEVRLRLLRTDDRGRLNGLYNRLSDCSKFVPSLCPVLCGQGGRSQDTSTATNLAGWAIDP